MCTRKSVVPCVFISVLLAMSAPGAEYPQESGKNFGPNFLSIQRVMGQVLKHPVWSLLERDDVQEELSLTEEQIADLVDLKKSRIQVIDILKKFGVTSIGEMEQDDAKQVAEKLVPVLRERRNRLLVAISEIFDSKQQRRFKQIRLQDMVLRHRRITHSDLKSVYDDAGLNASKLKELNAAVLKAEAEVRVEAQGTANTSLTPFQNGSNIRVSDQPPR